LVAYCRQVENRVNGWKKSHGESHTPSDSQLTWEANVVEYVNYLYHQTKAHGNSKDTQPKPLSKDIPLMGPRFIPPSYLHIQRRQPAAPVIEPESAYLKPLNVVHPFYYPGLARCPQCKSNSVLWEGWTTTGSRDVHGVSEEEMVLGFQLHCKDCEASGTAKGHRFCVATTNPVFWAKWEHWEIPSLWLVFSRTQWH
jgi:hypothetical protein